MTKIAIIGAGNMGGAIARGLNNAPYQVTVSNHTTQKLEVLERECVNINVTTDNREAARDASLVILALKPYMIESVISEITPVLSAPIVSLAAPINLETLKNLAKNAKQVIKAIPNTAISVGQGMTFIAAEDESTDGVKLTVDVFTRLGQVAVIAERLMPAATALCSCGLAYAMRYMRAAVEGAVELGLRPTDALDFEIATLRGACALLEANGSHPEAEIDRVTTPGGITIKGLNAMERNGFTNAVIEGLKASC